MSSLIGQTLGHYRVIDQLGAGGMGVVYRAEDLKLGRQVAIKVLPPGSAADHEAVERFRREARTASSLNHPNICTIYTFDEQGGQLYLAMELLDGEPLDRRLAGHPLDLRQVIEIGAQVADALEAAHAGGILHRDIKPANIFLTRRGQVKVLDFGLAKLAPERRRAHGSLETGTPAAEHFSSVAGTTVGTIAYMSPEQARGEAIDSRTDLFSFGVVLYEMATGRHSFAGQTTAVVFDAILNRDPAPPSTINPAVPAELDRIIMKALEKDPALRYQTAADLGSDLKRLRRDVTGRYAVPMTTSGASAGATPGKDTADTVVLSGGTPARLPLGGTAAYAAPDMAASGATGRVTPAAGSGSVVQRSSSVVLPASGSWLVGAGIGVLAIAVVAGSLGAYIATRGTSPQPSPAAAAGDTAPQGVAPATPASAAPGGGVPQPGPAPPASAAPPAPAPPASAAGPAPPPKAGARKAVGPPVKAAPTALAAVAPPTASRDEEAQQKLDVARAKMANQLNEQALADLRQILLDYPGSRAAAEASFLAAELLEKTGKLEDAMAAHVEFESRFAGDRRVAESKLRRALMMARTKLPQAEARSRELLNEVIRDYPGSPQAWQALQVKRRNESERRNVREFDPVLKTQVPIVVFTLRQIIDQFPRTPESVVAYSQLAMIYTQMDRHTEAAQVLESLIANFPETTQDVWFRLGEIYERRLKDPARAREAYGKVPPGSPNYAEAQRRLARKP